MSPTRPPDDRQECLSSPVMSRRTAPDSHIMASQSHPFPDRFPFTTKKASTLVPPPLPARSDNPAVTIPRPAPVPGKERRRSARQTLVARAIVRCDTAAGEVAAGYVSNISMLGVGFHARKPLPVGSMYQIKVEAGPMQWRSRVRVVSCVGHDTSGTWDVGAEFVGNELNADRARRASLAA